MMTVIDDFDDDDVDDDGDDDDQVLGLNVSSAALSPPLSAPQTHLDRPDSNSSLSSSC